MMKSPVSTPVTVSEKVTVKLTSSAVVGLVSARTIEVTVAGVVREMLLPKRSLVSRSVPEVKSSRRGLGVSASSAAVLPVKVTPVRVIVGVAVGRPWVLVNPATWYCV